MTDETDQIEQTDRKGGFRLWMLIPVLLFIVLLFFLGRTYAEPLDQVTELDPKRKVIAVLTLALFFLLFIPIPLRVIMP